MIALVVAHSANRVIGHEGRLPWHLPGDLARFKEITSGGTVVMGRKTYESIPEKFRPLPGRRNIVLSRNGFEADGVDVRRDLRSALAEDCFVIGGDTVYAQALPLADRLYVTEIEAEVDGDAFFPELPAGRWRCTEGERREENGLPYVFRVYDRAN